ncbi:MAG: hypothetical protein IH597_10870 [Bacteroidales bacterium]|nr:hypothetical protein [Bacteroidales bacterium]
MKKYLIRTLLFALISFIGVQTLHAQGSLIRKAKGRVEDKIIDKIFNDTDESKETETEVAEPESAETTRNRKGSGLSQDVPDVNQYIADADEAYANKSYSEAKAAARQAIWGVEIEIGNNILKSLPDNVEGLKAVPEEDRVTSTGVGFVGLVIERVYQGKDDMELRVNIGNDAALLGMAGMYMVSGMYQSTDETNQKQIRFKDHNATISYDDYDGYSLGVPFGQSSIFVVKGANFETEAQFMAAANHFDIDRIKKDLGE